MDWKKNDLVTVTIVDMGEDGEGIGKVDGFTVFVKDAVIGDTVEARLVKCAKNYAFARLEKVISPSLHRVQAPCPCHRQCGGCQLQTLSYAEQLRFKQNKVKNHLMRIGGFPEEQLERIMEPIVGMENPFRYRNKAQYPVGKDKDGHIVTGFYAGRTHTIIPQTDCLLGAQENEEILKIIVKHMEENHVTAYEEKTGRGLVRHVLIRKGFTSGEIMVCLVLNRGEGDKQGKKGNNLNIAGIQYLPGQQKLIENLRTVKGMTSICVNLNREKTNVIMGRKTVCLWGKPFIEDTIHERDMTREGFPCTGKDLTFCISPQSFYQVNPIQTEKLYSLALEYAGLSGKETVWDLYCGIGTISLFLASKAGKVYGVEVIPQAIADARDNARKNGITNVEFFVGKAEEILPAKYRNEGICADVIVVDPPRKGCDEKCLQTMLDMQPEKIVYISCNSATLARDMKILCEGGYRAERIRAVDQFAMTEHCECAVLMSRVRNE